MDIEFWQETLVHVNRIRAMLEDDHEAHRCMNELSDRIFCRIEEAKSSGQKTLPTTPTRDEELTKITIARYLFNDFDQTQAEADFVAKEIVQVLRSLGVFANRQTTPNVSAREMIMKEALRDIFRYTTNHQRDYAVKEMDDIYKIAFFALQRTSTSAQMRDLGVNFLSVDEMGQKPKFLPLPEAGECITDWVQRANARIAELNAQVKALRHEMHLQTSAVEERNRFKEALKKIAVGFDSKIVGKRVPHNGVQAQKIAREALDGLA